MKRMGALTGLTAVSVLSFAFFLDELYIQISICVFLLLLIFSFIIRKFRKSHSLQVVFSVAVLALIGFTLFTEYYYKPVVYNYPDKEMVISAKVAEPPYQSYNRYYYYLETENIDYIKDNVKILLKSEKYISAGVDDTIEFKEKIYALSNDSYKTKGCYLVVYGDKRFKCKVEKAKKHSIMNYVYNFRDNLESEINAYMEDDAAGICNAVAFGDKKSVTPRVTNVFRMAGVSHILVVSGLHMTLLATLFMLFTKKLFRSRFIYCPVTMLFIIFYMLMTGLSYSAVRSGIMVIIIVLAKLFRNQADSLNSLGISGLCIVAVNPYAAADVGFILSFSATLGIITLPKYILKYIESKVKFHSGIINYIINAVVITISAYVFVVPVLIIFFQNISLLSVVSNLLIQPVFGLLLTVIIVGAILSLIGFSVLYTPFLMVANYLSEFLYFAAKLVSEIPFAYVNTDKPFVYFWLVSTIVLIGFIFLIKNYRTTVPLGIAMSVTILISGTVSYYFYNYDRAFFTVYDTGNGITATVSHGENTAVLACGGDYYHFGTVNRLKGNLTSKNILSITDSKKGRSCYSDDIVEEFDLKYVLVYDKDKRLPEQKEENVRTFDSDSTFSLGEIEIRYLVRNNSVFTYMKCKGRTVLILPRYADCSLLDEKYRTANVVVTDSPSKDGELVKSDLLIIASTEETFPKIWNNNEISSKEIYTTFNGDYTSSLEVW